MSDNPRNIRLRCSGDVVAAVPYLVGFHPSDSFVVLAVGEETFVARFDLPAADRVAESAVLVAALIADRRPAQIAFVGYGTDAAVTPMMREVMGRVAGGDAEVKDALRVHDGTYWSYLCDDPACCPPEGRPLPAHCQAVAAAEAEGLVALDGRDDLVESVAPAASDAMAEATRRAEARFVQWVKDGADDVRERMVAEGLPLVTSLIEGAACDAPPPSDDDVAWLGILLTHLRVRDEAWVRIDADDVEAHVRLWSDVLRRVDDAYAAGPACLLAFAAWRGGNGALANVALDRSDAVDPGYVMAALMRDVVDSGLPPWALPPPMTPQELKEEWEEGAVMAKG